MNKSSVDEMIKTYVNKVTELHEADSLSYKLFKELTLDIIKEGTGTYIISIDEISKSEVIYENFVKPFMIELLEPKSEYLEVPFLLYSTSLNPDLEISKKVVQYIYSKDFLIFSSAIWFFDRLAPEFNGHINYITKILEIRRSNTKDERIQEATRYFQRYNKDYSAS
jgi:hypothetical protein